LQVPVHYYISPKLWAWKEYRLKDIKLYVDKMYCIFPFEVEFYAKRGYKVEYVGNPTVDTIADFKKEMKSIEDFRTQNKLEAKPIIAILAGSRKQEISACLGRMIASTENFTDYQPVIAGAPGIEPEFYSSVLKGTKIYVVYGQTYDLLSNSSVALVNSGTATLETALIGTPQVVVYHVIFGRAAYAIKDFFIKVKYFSLVNLMAQKEVVKELVAHHFTIENVRKELSRILTDKDYRNSILTEYEVLNKQLGLPGAAKRTAKRIYETINKGRLS
jgi:lipid-A-disaccharide synthase